MVAGNAFDECVQPPGGIYTRIQIMPHRSGCGGPIESLAPSSKFDIGDVVTRKGYNLASTESAQLTTSPKSQRIHVNLHKIGVVRQFHIFHAAGDFIGQLALAHRNQ